MTTISLKTGEVVQVDDIVNWLLMSDEEYLNWEATHLGKHDDMSDFSEESDTEE